ncbi:Trk system potassium uptake protein [Arenimonas maotaiensis]|uniref:Trk system potassium uptake protein n=1 Tax=Arenimonas maotaiensis TaxID=1446479 RepID=A0A917CQF8_9GAMM|nr:potassium transporter TrkG [Arenimonas maotaiensis]GGF95493.1 Trk system potassium uptake protein [Arenimonas maotaiensis]
MSTRAKAIARVFGAVTALSSMITLPSLALALLWGEPTALPFAEAGLPPMLAGALLWFMFRHSRYELRVRDGFVVTAGIWIIASLVTAVPFYLALPQLSYTDAVFEATSGLTTTGATVLTGLDALPRSLLFFRSSLNFFGGMGIVILAVAVLPMLKIGGMHLFKTEITGPVKDNKLTPRIAETARTLWVVYIGLNLLCALAYWAAGMDWFDAVNHAMTTVATAGFSTHDASFGYWDSALIEGIAIAFMLLGGISFSMHWYAWRAATVSHYQASSEFRAYIAIAVTFVLLVTGYLWLSGEVTGFDQSLRHAAFQTVSHLTTTGYASTGFSHWPGMLPVLMVMLAFIGGCSSSTAGGIKVARVQLVIQQGLRELKQLVHPKAQYLVTMGGKRVSESVVISVAGFCALYITVYVVLVLLLSADGLDLPTAFSAAASCLNNLGPGLGQVTLHYQVLSDFSTWLMSFAMLLGRLEIFTVLVFFMPSFWQE